MKTRYCVCISALLLLFGCASQTTQPPPGSTALPVIEEADALAAPPPLGAEKTAGQNAAVRAGSTELPAAASDDAAPDNAVAVGDTVFPGLKRQPAANGDELPFEESLSEREQRIKLGLEPPRQEREPVNNVVDWEF